MKKGQKKRIWTKEQKIEIIEKHLKEHVSVVRPIGVYLFYIKNTSN